MNNKLLERLETIIFLSKDPLSVEELSKFFNIDCTEMKTSILKLKENRRETGINIKIENDFISLVSNPLFGEDVKNFFNPEMKLKKLSKSAMETLAIIAYKGPITKGEIEKIRGVGVEKVMSNLLEKNLVYISGKKKSIGTPNLYTVTEDFYSYLNITEKSELPGYSQYEKIELLYKENEEKSSEEPCIIDEIKEIDKKENVEVENEIK